MSRDNAVDPGDRESKADPIDVHVGLRVRIRRQLLRLSQEKLGEALGLTFQQIQKYERGVNRIGASRLFYLSRELDVPIGFFFDALPDVLTAAHGVPASRVAGFAESQDGFGNEIMNSREAVELVRAYHRIVDPMVRKRMFELVKSLVPEGDQ